MVVRIRLSLGPTIAQKQRKNRHVALAMASLLMPITVLAYVLAFWRLTADFKATNQFPITDGIFSHWQVWMAAAAVLQLIVLFLNRYGNARPVLRKTVTRPETNLVDSRP